MVDYLNCSSSSLLCITHTDVAKVVVKSLQSGIRVNFMGLIYGVAGKESEGKSRHTYHLEIRRHNAATDSECIISQKQQGCRWWRVGEFFISSIGR